MAKIRHIPLDVILKTGGWRSIKLYVRYNDRPTVELQFAQAYIQRTALK